MKLDSEYINKVHLFINESHNMTEYILSIQNEMSKFRSSRFDDHIETIDTYFDTIKQMITKLENLGSMIDFNFISQSYIYFNKHRKYYTEGMNDVNKLVSVYKDNIQIGYDTGINGFIELGKLPNTLRVMSWNVRYWTNVNNELTIYEIGETINKIAPDIVLLQEATTGVSKYNPQGIDIQTICKDYFLLTSCNSVPSWYNTVYGIIVLMKKELYEAHMSYGSIGINGEICKLGHTVCDFNQYATTFAEPSPTKKIVTGNIMRTMGSRETNCYVKISLTEFDIIATHFNSTGASVRMKQIDQIDEMITRPTIIMGDYNIIDKRPYLSNYNYLSEYDHQNRLKEWEYIKRINVLNDNIDDGEIPYMNSKKWLSKMKYDKVDNGNANDNNKIFKDTIQNLYEMYDYAIEEYGIIKERKTNIIDEIAENKVFTLIRVFDRLQPNIAGIFSNIIRPSVSVWTNVVVDHFFHKHSPMMKYNTYTHFNNYSDHLPLIIDINDNEYNVFLRQAKRKDVINKQLEIVDTLNEDNYILEKFIKNNPERIFSNGQPLISYDWYDLSNMTDNKNVNIKDGFTFSDPYTTGNFGMSLGTKGIYMCHHNKNCVERYGKHFQIQYLDNDITIQNMNNSISYNVCGLRDSYLGFYWKLTTDDVKIKEPTFGMATPAYDILINNYDSKNDILYLSDNVFKITHKNYDSNTGISNIVKLIDVVLITSIYKDNNMNDMNVMKISDYDDSKKLMNIITKYKSDYGMNDTDIQNLANIFMNAIWFINHKHMEKTNEIYIDPLFFNGDQFDISHIDNVVTLRFHMIMYKNYEIYMRNKRNYGKI